MLQVEESWEEFSSQCERKSVYCGGHFACGVTNNITSCLQATCPRLASGKVEEKPKLSYPEVLQKICSLNGYCYLLLV
jgi:hypothetical protein